MAWPNLDDGSILEIILKGSLYSQAIMLVRHYQFIQEFAAAMATDVVYDALAAEWNLAGSAVLKFADIVTDAQTIDYLQVQTVYPVRRAYKRYVPAATAGVSSEAPFPPATACALTLQSIPGGRHGTGTVHIGVPPSDQMSFGKWALIYQATVLDFGLQISDRRTLAGGQILAPVIFNRADPNLSIEVVGCSVQETIRTEKRRVVGRGT